MNQNYLYRLLLACFFSISFFNTLNAAPAITGNAEFIGSGECKSCHIDEYKSWQQSDHFKAMQAPTAETVLANFNNKTVEFHNIKSRFYKKDKDFFVETIGRGGTSQHFKIKYTFGHYPLQQYLVDTGKGHIQALNIAWDSRDKTEGGQRWYHLQPDENITSEHPFFWSGHFQNWNTRCADCHSTNVVKNYNPKQMSYHTTFSEINVACEACHGPGSDHVKLAKSDKLTKDNLALAFTKPAKINWTWKEGDPIANPQGEPSTDHIDMCGGCHSRRLPLKEIKVGADYHDQYRLELLGENLYFDDGQIQDEVFVLGSFLQSKMHESGVTCQNCHNPHSGKLVAEGNSLCAQCHAPATFDTPKHHKHPIGTPGAECVSCHMPTRTYMGVDDRRDHSFKIPHPDITQTDKPNACTNCHQDKNNQWAADELQKWPVKIKQSKWVLANQKARQQDSLGVAKIAAAASDTQLPAIMRATLYQALANFPSQISVQAAKLALMDSNPLIRRSAVSSLAGLPADMRWQILEPMLKDKNTSVRFEVAAMLADVLDGLSNSTRQKISGLLDEYETSIKLVEDSPSSQVSLANLAMRRNQPKKAEQAYLTALKLTPAYIPALLNLADLYRSQGHSAKEEELLKEALKIMPDSSAVQHSYGLLLIRSKQYNKAIPYLKEATELEDSQPRYAYVYAVALDGVKQTARAIEALKAADKRWPNQYELLATQILFMEKLGLTNQILRPLSKLSMIAPNAPQVQSWVQKYARQ